MTRTKKAVSQLHIKPNQKLP
uniref:Uncharacterized protein n=1 Tax=Glossina morsitans morsitans TaxID=37546 RepID=A0A1B0FNU1_GLOMM